MSDDPRNIIIEIIADKTGVETSHVTDASTLEDLDIDSLTGLEVVLKIEDEFGIRLEESKIGSSNTVGDLVALVQSTVDRG